MTRDPGIPEHQTPGNPSRPGGDQRRGNPVSRRTPGVPKNGASRPRSPRPPLPTDRELVTPNRAEPRPNQGARYEFQPPQHRIPRSAQPDRKRQTTVPLSHQQPERAEQPIPKDQSYWLKWFYNWKLWLIATLVLFGGSGMVAAMLLFQIPGLPNCPAIFWPLASASLRFECARLAASKQTAKDLLEAIALVDSLPPDHPMREEANRLVEEWSQDVLRLAEEDFNAGKLGDAIASARRIPSKVTAYKLIEERIKRWQSIWSEAEEIYKKSEELLRKQDFRQAFSNAVRLLDVENEYWRTTKFEELSNRITVTRNDGNKLGRAYRLADAGGLNNVLQAIKLVESIRPESYLYQAAQQAIPKFGRQMLEMAQAALDRRNLREALDILDKIPEKAYLKDEVRDYTILVNAQSQVWQNTVPAVEEAISQAQRIGTKSPLYRKAQQLITRWQLEIEAIAQLEKARLIAQSGSVDDLNAGIAEANLIGRANPRWDEAQQQIRRWRAQIETIQDRPILEQADQLASGGDLPSLQAAIAQAKQVGRGRALSREALNKIQKWTAEIQRIQDEPILLQAREYANAGDLRGATSLAQQIRSGRSLYNEAQADVRRWQDRIQEETVKAQAIATMQEARQLANSGSPNNLATAIQVADRVPAASSLRGEAASAINEWSQQLLQVAKTQASYDLPGAIAIAQKIPSRAPVYAEAQQLIESWKRTLGL
ncbi:hypothetical protein [Leptothermofonsia sp. ETS-13]|uniref:hypothetical protein n=1 Tax=Leptothermofonsia sp. ETS-13 TaxID=3035696 RepID=UPI003BA27018